jgi:hypothetical protein
MRTTFEDALGYFSDGSVDRLNIDGRHSYDDVRHVDAESVAQISEWEDQVQKLRTAVKARRFEIGELRVDTEQRAATEVALRTDSERSAEAEAALRSALDYAEHDARIRDASPREYTAATEAELELARNRIADNERPGESSLRVRDATGRARFAAQ